MPFCSRSIVVAAVCLFCNKQFIENHVDPFIHRPHQHDGWGTTRRWTSMPEAGYRKLVVVIRRIAMALVVFAAAGLAGYWYAVRIEPEWVEVERVEVGLKALPASFEGYRIDEGEMPAPR